jgi:drug/metabolite transporter (DMT)-like permease
MLWFVLAITAMFLFALIGVIQGIAIKKYSLNGRKYLLYTMLLQGAISGLVFLFKPVTYYEFSFILLSISGGFFFVYGLLPYMKAVEFEEVSRLNPLFNLGPVFVFVLSIIFLETILSNSNFIGFIFLILGGILISIKKTKGFIKFSKGFWYMILTNLLLGFYFIITDYLFKRYDY